MKKIISILVCAIALSPMFAQKISVSESGDAVITTVYGTDQDDVAKAWKSIMKKYDAKVDYSKSKVIAKGAVIKEMGKCLFDVTATFEKVKDGEVKVVVLFDPIATAEAKTPDRSSYMSEAKRIVHDYALKRTSESVDDEINDAQKVYDKLVKVSDGLTKDNVNLADDIEGYKKKITNAERDIVINKGKIETQKALIADQQKVVDAIKKKQKALD